MPEEINQTKLPLPQETEPAVFAEVTPIRRSVDAAITVQIGSAEIQIHNGADAEIIETALRALSKIC